jgi:PAS domain S-box-containing protein
MHGYDSPDEVIGHPFALTQVDVDQKAAGKIVETMLAGGKSTSGEFSRHCRDGSTRNHSFSTHPVVTAGEIVGLEGFIIDTTDRKQAEDEIKLKNEELKKANAEKDKFFSIIAHDLRSPFQAFLGLTQEMAEEFPRLAKDEMQEIAVGMRDSATNLFRLLENLLEWARIQQGAIPFNPDVVKLHPVVDESAATALQAAKNKGIDIACDIPNDIAIFADTNMLQTIIRNLVSNAVKFTPQGGRVSISAKNTGDKSVEISIRDSGIGMSKAIVDNLFRLDVRTNRKGTNGELSTGLGLLLCKEFIEKHGGRIWVESEEGKGSAFYFTIPCNTVTGKENVIKNIDPAVAEDNQIKQLKILIAEDDEKSELLIAIAVKKFARELLRVKNGMDAIEVCRNNSDLDLVLMDIEMPEINGYEATRQIRHFNQNVVIIAQTAYALAGEREKVIAAGCNDYIAKPYNKTSLTALLKKYF